MAKTVANLGEKRDIHLFDSFHGIPHLGPKDEPFAGIEHDGLDEQLVTTGVSACSREDVARNIARWGAAADNLIYHEGWFQDTVPPSDTGPIALLRLDGDLYESTRICLEYLYLKVTSGGFVIIDDYNLTGCRLATEDYREANAILAEMHTVPGGEGAVWWRKD